MSNTRRQKSTHSLDKKTQEDVRRLVMERIKAASGDLRIAVGSEAYTKLDLLKSVEKGDEIGKKIIAAQMEYLRDMAAGKIYQKDDE